MSTTFQYPNTPIGWQGSPVDLSGDVADVPYMGLRTSETTQRFVMGTRCLTWDGRVFKYARASGAVVSYHGVVCNEDHVLIYTALAASAAAGDTSVSCALTDRSEDDLAGGYITVYPTGSSSIDNAMSRCIVGNDASGATNTTYYLDEPLSHAAAVTTCYCEVFENPYREVAHTGTSTGKSVIGVPARTAATLEYLWIQTWGPCVVSMGELGVSTGRNRDFVWWDNGTLLHLNSAADALYQRAGFMINATAGGTFVGPLIMLQLSI